MNPTIDILPISQELEDLTYTDIELFHYDIGGEYKKFMSESIKQNLIYQLDQDLSIPRSSNSALIGKIRLYIFTNHPINITNNNRHFAVFPQKERFKVIGLKTYKNNACVVVLHLPHENWEEFYKDNSSIDNQLVHVATRDFEVQIDSMENPDFAPSTDNKVLYSLAHNNN
ncbi:MAG: hypothetical protein PHW22_02095 [Bacilli bacterium]|nr:hypothetical protein [Bacilli bacterium]